MDMFYEYKLGEKYLSFNNDKIFKVQASFISHLSRIFYFLSREERLEYSIILSRLTKDNDPEIVRVSLPLSRSFRATTSPRANRWQRKSCCRVRVSGRGRNRRWRWAIRDVSRPI
jgi:hypothetical protein